MTLIAAEASPDQVIHAVLGGNLIHLFDGSHGVWPGSCYAVVGGRRHGLAPAVEARGKGRSPVA